MKILNRRCGARAKRKACLLSLPSRKEETRIYSS